MQRIVIDPTEGDYAKLTPKVLCNDHGIEWSSAMDDKFCELIAPAWKAAPGYELLLDTYGGYNPIFAKVVAEDYDGDWDAFADACIYIGIDLMPDPTEMLAASWQAIAEHLASQ